MIHPDYVQYKNYLEGTSMVKVISTVPHPSVVKQAICKNCGAVLEYTPKDIQSHTYKDYDGSTDTDYFITCPPCGERVHVKRY